VFVAEKPHEFRFSNRLARLPLLAGAWFHFKQKRRRTIRPLAETIKTNKCNGQRQWFFAKRRKTAKQMTLQTEQILAHSPQTKLGNSQNSVVQNAALPMGRTATMT
jgi:hypothetical protein